MVRMLLASSYIHLIAYNYPIMQYRDMYLAPVYKCLSSALSTYCVYMLEI